MFEMIGKVGIGGWEYDKQVIVFRLYIHTMKYYSALKKEILTCAIIWMIPGDMLTEMSIRKRQIPYGYTYVRYLQ